MRKPRLFIVCFTALVLLNFPVVARAGKISGTVQVKGLRSPANILVYLAKTPALGMDFEGASFDMDQKDLTFYPHVLPIPVGATVRFPNSDKVDHNVFSLSRTKKFNLGSYKPGEAKTIRFDRSGIVELRCDVHAEMLAYILVMKNPYYAVTDAKGRFEIPDVKLLGKQGIKGVPDLPAGEYHLKTWHKKLKSTKASTILAQEGVVSIQLNLTRGPSSVLYKR